MPSTLKLRPGQVRVGMCVRTVVPFAAYPAVKVGTLCTVRGIQAQLPGAQSDAVLVHPHALGWYDVEVFLCTTDEIELTWPDRNPK